MTITMIAIGAFLILFAYFIEEIFPKLAQYVGGVGAGVLIALAIFWMIPDGHATTMPTITLFKGDADLNAGSTVKTYSPAFQVEQETPVKSFIFDLGYLNEGSLHGRKRDGFYGMVKLPYQFMPKLETSLAVGPYLNATTVEANNGTDYHYCYGLSILTALSVKYQATHEISLQARYQHAVFATDGHDTDQIMLGVGYTPVSW